VLRRGRDPGSTRRAPRSAAIALSPRLPYTPHTSKVRRDPSSKTPGVVSTGRAAQPSSCQGPACAITRTPSKLRGTFGPSRSAYKRPEPSADLLAADADDGGGRPCYADCHVNEGLVQIELVLVDHRPRSADATVLEARVEFGPDAHARSDVHIGV